MNQGRIIDNESESGLCVILYAAKLVQSAENVLTKTDLCNLLQQMMESNEDRSSLERLQNEITSLMLVSQKNTHLSVYLTGW